jgi:hypothetical protein
VSSTKNSLKNGKNASRNATADAATTGKVMAEGSGEIQDATVTLECHVIRQNVRGTVP